MHNILYCDLSNFRKDLLNVAIMSYIQTDDIFEKNKTDYCAPYISKTTQVKNLKQTIKVLQIFHL